jgi:hypothetical protein
LAEIAKTKKNGQKKGDRKNKKTEMWKLKIYHSEIEQNKTFHKFGQQ